jgi:CheY-specific phosphatase CheX
MMHAMHLQSAATSTFEELTFLLPSPELDEVQAAAAAVASVAVAFTGDRSGVLRLRLCGPVLPQLAANMLGSGEPPALLLQCDALGELANVICGNVLPAVAGAHAVIRLSPPQVVLGAGDDDVMTDAVVLGLEEGRVELRLCLEAS